LQFALVLALVALMSVALPAAAGSPPATRDAKASTKVFEKSSAIVVFKSLPLATYDGRIKGYEKTRPAGGKHVNANSAAAKKYLGYLKTQHSAYATWLRANAPGAKITSNLYVTLNAVGVKLNGNAVKAQGEHGGLGRRVHDPVPAHDERVAQYHQRRRRVVGRRWPV